MIQVVQSVELEFQSPEPTFFKKKPGMVIHTYNPVLRR